MLFYGQTEEFLALRQQPLQHNVLSPVEEEIPDGEPVRHLQEE